MKRVSIFALHTKPDCFILYAIRRAGGRGGGGHEKSPPLHPKERLEMSLTFLYLPKGPEHKSSGTLINQIMDQIREIRRLESLDSF